VELQNTLKNLTIIDLTTMWSGPFASLLLAGLGAHVIKIESVRRLDGTRFAALPSKESPVFEVLNREKESMMLELDTEEGRQGFFRLVRNADLVIENFSPRVLKNLRINFENLLEVNPQIILISMPAVGGKTKESGYISYGSGIEAMAGAAWLTGYEDGLPLGAGVPFSDPLAGMYGAFLCLAAILQRNTDQQARHWELSQMETVQDIMGEMIDKHECKPSFLDVYSPSYEVLSVKDVWEKYRYTSYFLDDSIPYLNFPWLSSDTKWEINKRAARLAADHQN
jgi:crotonobetainyl-CoA:carnitine CoA-transferase CaiB-like acyl-CoA transferase